MEYFLFSTVYRPAESVKTVKMLVAKAAYPIKQLTLFVDKNPKPDTKEHQEKTVSELKSAFKNIFPVEVLKIDLYEIPSIITSFLKAIDSVPTGHKIIFNISHGRKTQFISAYLAALKRLDRIEKIIYITEEEGAETELPKIAFLVNEQQRKVLELIEKDRNISNLAEKVGQSRPMIYKHIENLINKGFLKEEKEGYSLTYSGKIAIL